MQLGRLLPEKTVGRLSLYRRLLYRVKEDGGQAIYSHQLAAIAGVTAAQVRRDIMEVGYSGDPQRGYDIGQLAASIGELLDSPRPVPAAIVGIGNLGRALAAYFSGRSPKLAITAGFDIDPYKVDRVVLGCRCYPMSALASVVREQRILVAVVAVPAAEAQGVADKMEWAGIRGILNFAPVRLKVGPDVYVENVDMTMSLEKVAYFATRGLTTSGNMQEET